jgi:DNA-binding HxlR family transcriptional regulator
MPKIETNNAPFSYDGLDRVIHEKARLGLLASLMAHPKGLAFADLKQLCGLTDGNLSRHLQVLQEAGLVEVTKGYEGNRPHTSCRLTKTGWCVTRRKPRASKAPHPPGSASCRPDRHPFF